jgi:proton-translocating NADH-quinone oxidoreductase chain M
MSLIGNLIAITKVNYKNTLIGILYFLALGFSLNNLTTLSSLDLSIWGHPILFSTNAYNTLFILLTLAIGAVCNLVSPNKSLYLFLLNLTIFVLLSVFSINNTIGFYILFEFVLIPLFILILKYGYEERKKAAITMFLYNFIASLFMLFGILYISSDLPNYSFKALKLINLSDKYNLYALFLILLSFLIKLPVWPFHHWLLKAHTQAPTSISMLLASVVLKMGGYGLIVFLTPFKAALFNTKYLIYVSIFGVIFISLITFMQTNLKKLIAYSSVSHMGFALVGILLSLTNSSYVNLSLTGSILILIAHGLCSAGLFLCVGIIHKRFNTFYISKITGLWHKMPLLSLFLVILLMANLSLPLSLNFAGEFLVLLCAFESSIILGLLLGLSFITTAAYSLNTIARIVFGEQKGSLSNLSKSETVSLITLTVPIFILGAAPFTLQNYIIG